MWFVALLLAATAAERAPDSEYTTEAMISILKRGRWFGEDSGVPSDFECAWRKAAFAQASVLQPELKLAQRGDLHGTAVSALFVQEFLLFSTDGTRLGQMPSSSAVSATNRLSRIRLKPMHGGASAPRSAVLSRTVAA
eukprot:m.227873 g.227873  ORF g.227873 m.227873 type:complete len:138 (+) comp15667_c0_seq13:79-492(+)